jgi:DNA repair ATPase RecN
LKLTGALLTTPYSWIALGLIQKQVRVLVIYDDLWITSYLVYYIAPATANSGTQTDDKLLEYIEELQVALATAEEKIAELRKEIEEDIPVLQEARSKYRNLWMTERRYSKQLEEAGAEAGGYGQARSSESSSPYYRCRSLISWSPH